MSRTALRLPALAALLVMMSSMGVGQALAQGGVVTIDISLPGAPYYQGDDDMISIVEQLTIANDGAALGSREYYGTLNLTNNDLLIDYTGASPIADIVDMVRAGYNTFGWDGKGITSSVAASDPLRWAVGVVDNAEMLAFGFGYGDGVSDFNGDTIPEPLYHGIEVDPTTIIVKFTYQGDADLDGLLTGFDYFLVDTFAGMTGGWYTGDFNYDTLTGDGFDYFLLDNNFVGDALTISLPEPASAGLLLAGVMAMGLRRRR